LKKAQKISSGTPPASASAIKVAFPKGSLGLSLASASGAVVVKGVKPKSFAETSGVTSGKIIVSVDGLDCKGMGVDKVMKLLKTNKRPLHIVFGNPGREQASPAAASAAPAAGQGGSQDNAKLKSVQQEVLSLKKSLQGKEKLLKAEQAKNKKMVGENEKLKKEVEKFAKRAKGGKKGAAVERDQLDAELTKVKKEYKELKGDHEELQEDFEELRKDFQMVREDKDAAVKKSEEAAGDTSSVLMTIDGLRSLSRISFDGLRKIENAVLIDQGKVKKPKDWDGATPIQRIRTLQNDLRQGLHGMNVDVSTDEEKAAMELVQGASEEHKEAAAKIQKIQRGRQARRELTEKRQKEIELQKREDQNAAALKKGNLSAKDKEKLEKEKTALLAEHEKLKKEMQSERVRLQREHTTKHKKLKEELESHKSRHMALKKQHMEHQARHEKVLAEHKAMQANLTKQHSAKKRQDGARVSQANKNLTEVRKELKSAKEGFEKSQQEVTKLQGKIKAMGRRIKAQEKSNEELNRRLKEQIALKRKGGPDNGPSDGKEDVQERPPSTKETNAAATKVQAHVRRRQTQQNYNKKKERLRFEKDRNSLVKKARRCDQLEQEVKRLRDRVLTLQKEGATSFAQKTSRQSKQQQRRKKRYADRNDLIEPDSDYDDEAEALRDARNEDPPKANRGRGAKVTRPEKEMIDLETFDAIVQELEMLQAAYNSVKKDMGQEKKKCVRLQRLRAAAEEEASAVRDTNHQLQRDLDEERMAAAVAEEERKIQDEEDEASGRRRFRSNGPMLPDMSEHLHMQLRASEDGRMAALLELQRLKAQLDYHRDSDAEQKLKISQLEDRLNALREAKRRTEMHTLKVEEALEEQAINIRSRKREVESLKRQVGTIRETTQRESNNLFANLNMLTQQQQMIAGTSSMSPRMEVVPYATSPKNYGQRAPPLSSPDIRVLNEAEVGTLSGGVQRSGYARIHMKPTQPTLIRQSPAPRRGGRRRGAGPKANVSPLRSGGYGPTSPTAGLQKNIQNHKRAGKTKERPSPTNPRSKGMRGGKRR
jgi:hypothetical protein